MCSTFIAQLCSSIKVKSHLKNVDQLIATVKSAAVTSKTRQTKFAIIDYPPQPVVTKWVGWLNDALYYATSVPKLKVIVESFERPGILVT